MKVHEKNCINVQKFDKNFKAIRKIEMRRQVVYQNNYTKKDIKRNPLMKVEA